MNVLEKLIKIYICAQIIFFVGNSYINAQVYPESIVHISGITQNLSAPHRMAINSNGELYVTDVSNRRVVKYDASGNYIKSWNPGGSPLSVAINSLDELFYGDSKSGIIYKLQADGTFLEFYSGLRLPNSMAFDTNDLLYVVDSEYKQVAILSTNGVLLGTIGDGTLLYPTGIAFDQTNNRILVAEHGGLGSGFKPVVKVWIFDLDGNLIQSFGKHGNADGEFYRIQGLTVDACGLIYVVDPYLSTVSVFSSSGVFITKFGEYGQESGMLNVPMDIIINADRQALVSSMNSGVVEIYDVNKIYPGSTISTGPTTLCASSSFPVELTGTPPWNLTYTIDGLNPVTVNGITENPYNLIVSSAGIYAITELSDAFCSGVNFTGEANISLHSSPSVSISTTSATLCSVDFIDVELLGTAPWSLNYTIDGTDSVLVDNILTSPYSIPISQVGVYEVISVSDANCLTTGLSEAATITSGSLPTATIIETDPILCQGSTVDIEIELSGTAPWSITYEIDGANPVDMTNITASPYFLQATQAGQYTITAVSDAGNVGTCIVGTANVVENALPSSNITTGVATLCPGENISIELTGESPWSLTYEVGGANPVTIDGITEISYGLPVSQTGVYTVVVLSDAYCSGNNFVGSADVTIRETPTASLINDNICLGETTSIPVYLTGTAPWNLELAINESNKTNTANITESPYYIPVTQSGTYQAIAVTDVYCEGTELNGSVVVNVKPTSDITPVLESVCDGQTVPLNFTGTAPWTFNYTIDDQIQTELVTNSQTYALPVSETGIYQIVTLSDANCSGNELGINQLITVNSLPTTYIDSEPASVCYNQNIPVMLTGNAPWEVTYTVNGLNPKTITTTESNSHITIEESGVYAITNVSDLNCAGIEFIGNKAITMKELPTALIANGNKEAELCEGESIDLAVEFTGIAPWEFTYTVEGLNPLTILSDNTYYVISATELGAYDITSLSDANCTNYKEAAYTDLLINSKPDVFLGDDIAFCDGQSQQLDAGGPYRSYLWSEGSTSQSIDVASLGSYSVEVTNDFGCKDLDDIFVNVNPLPIINLGEDVSICEGESINLDAGGPFNSYLWSEGSTSQLINVASLGSYSVEVTNDFGCKGSDSIFVNVNPLPIINLGEDVSICEGESINLDAGGSFNSYLWSDDSQTQSIVVSQAGSYSVQVTDENLCENTDEIVITVQPKPIADFGYMNNDLEVIFANNSMNADSYLWNFGDNSNSMEANPIHTYTSSGTYNVSLAAISEICGEDIYSLSLSVLGTFVEQVNSENGLKVYPNPSKGKFSIKTKEKFGRNLLIKIFDLKGKLVYSSEDNSYNMKTDVDISYLKGGIYTIRLSDKSYEANGKIILVN